MKALMIPLFLSALSVNTVTAAMSDDAMFKMNDKGELVKPEGYREWVYVGTPVTPNDMNDGKAAFPEFHNVYIDPISYKHWKETGKFRDGTIIIKDLVDVGSKAAVSGKGYFMGDFIGLEATVKSAKYFPKEPNNWAYFSFTTKDHKSLNPVAKAFPTESCAACHQAAAADDMVFTQYYPVLRAAKGKEQSSAVKPLELKDLALVAKSLKQE
jgi:hypothetical protein